MARSTGSFNEESRLKELEDYRVLDTPPEQTLDDLATLAAQICETPIALISLVDAERQWFKARVGLEATETPRECSFCAHALNQTELLVVPDATKDARFAENPLVIGPHHFRFYTGAPLVTPGRRVIGTLCVLDHVPRTLTSAQERALQVLSRQVMTHFEMRRQRRIMAENDRLLWGIFAAEPECLHVFDAEGQLEMINGAGLRILEADSLEELKGRNVVSMVAPEDRDAFKALMERVFRGESGILQFRATGLKGSHRWLETHAAPQRDETGKIIALLGITRDITERKKSEDDLRASEERYRALFEYAPDGILIIDARTDRYLDVNASMARMLGYTREEILGMAPAELVPPSEAAYLEPALKQVKSGEEYHRESRFKRKDGSVFDVDVIGTLTRDGNILAMVRDISDKKRTELRFRRLVESSAQGIMFWNSKGEIIQANDGMLRLLGYSREDLEAGRLNWEMLTPPEHAEKDVHALEEILATGTTAPFEKEYLRKDGSRVPVLLGVAGFDDTPGEGVCFVLDLTERKKLEQEVLRTQRIESIGTLAGGIAHDLNNTLGPIVTAIELLQMKFPDPSAQELISIISASAQRGAEMVRQVLAFARGVEGRRTEVQIQGILKDVARIASDTFSKDIQIRTMLPEDLWGVMGDPTQIHQVLLNLCVNARDAMPDGGILTLAAENLRVDAQYAGLDLEAKPGPYVLIQVRDTGAGMNSLVLEKIFDPFFTTKAIGKGTGLGLSTSLAIVKSHGGFIRAYSEPDGGTEFKVYLPSLTATPVAEEASRPEMPRGHNELVLVVDDEEPVRKITQQTLEVFGYRVILASDGAEALGIFGKRSSEIAVVLTDMMMPIMDGPATIQVLQKMNPRVRIIGASGLSTGDHVARARRFGVKYFLPKPYTADSLLKALQQILAEEVPPENSGI